MRYPDLKNGLFLIFAGWKVFLFVYCISIDLIYFLTVFRIFGVTVGCFFHLYLQRIMESYQELLYIFVVSLISDRVAILRTRINDGKIQNIQNISRVLRELKENFQLINTYFSMLLLIKLSNSFLTILLAVSLIIDGVKKDTLNFFGLIYMGGWIAMLGFDVLVYFYCVDRCLVDVRTTKIL